jgi:hypothetical protein
LSVPPLLMLAQGRRARPRKAAIARPKELALHMAVADLLRRFARLDWRWAHYPAGEHRDVRTAAKLKAVSVQPWWPDIILFNPSGKLHALELKRLGESLSDDQQDFQSWAIAHDIPHSVSRPVDEAMATLGGWGALRVKIGCGL